MILHLIICMAAAWAVAWAVLGIADHRAARRPPARIGQPVRHAVPPLPSRARGNLARARSGPARTHRPGGRL
ncbi:hypothetical protein [Streptomyces sp. TRM68416]|uniref:hypothetical protein n=1 Tax=Streptomyces sp. TRM68416 TaxID=2758412 RepID=UPI0016620DEA|nr:hypothetical protein [Streptomyces sp. TRM68416]MBD0837397.1 hypothetical protein [Streptomyces sp. TRM68416]